MSEPEPLSPEVVQLYERARERLGENMGKLGDIAGPSSATPPSPKPDGSASFVLEGRHQTEDGPGGLPIIIEPSPRGEGPFERTELYEDGSTITSQQVDPRFRCP